MEESERGVFGDLKEGGREKNLLCVVGLKLECVVVLY